jgi:hypothetical protein
MKTTSLWIIRLALTVQFVGVLAVPSLVAAADSPRAMWMAEWVNAVQAGDALSPGARDREGRTIGVLKIRDGKLSFVEQIGQVDWELDLATVNRVAVINGGRSLVIGSVTGEEFVVSIMEANLTLASPRKAIALIERAVKSVASNSR